ncbi:unnamed protein product [Auanema sp. JU1783]|nr:unnamed protein product [Auanema sp. JU1783]
MLPALRNAILNIEPFSNDPDHKKADEITSSYPVRALEALQSVFAHLVGYELDSYTPAEFWSTFRMSKEMVHLNEQQDALEFYNSVVEFVDEGMSMLGGEKICENTFGGLFADEKICKDCPHRYSREEPFTSISIDVQSHNNLLESLKEYVLGDVLENDNAYFCEKCQKKVRAIKRLTIQKLPPILVVQLKRFKFDWDKEVPVKFNDYVEFPFDLDMKPYTAEAAAKVDALGDTEEDIVLEEEPSDCMYSLRGVVVHSGSATGGHYYSFIKSSDDGKWYKFDDTEVNHYECDIKDVRSKWFGGNIKYADDGSDDMSSKKRGRCWWNAYLLFYEKVGTADQECSASSTSCRTPTSGRTSADCSGQASVSIANPLTVDASVSSISSRRSSTGSPITRLHKHFSTMSLSSKMRQMPPRLEVMVRQQNTKIMHERNQYNVNYFRFLKEITLRSVTYQTDTYNHILFVHISELFANFLVFTCLHASAELRNDYNDRNTILWNHVLDRLVVVKTCRLWLMSHILISEEILRVFLIEAKDPEVRQLYARIISKISLASIDHKDTIADAKTYNALPFQRALAMYGKENLRDSTCVVEMLIEVVYNMISNDKEKRGMEIYSVLLIFIIEPAPKPQLYLSLVRRGILFLLLRIYETPVMQCFAAIHNGIQNYLRLLLGLLRTIDLRTYLSVRLPGAPALTTPCPYMLAELKERIPINDIVCPSDLQDAIYAVPSYNLMTHLMNVFASGDLRVQGFMRETFLYFCWNNEIITARAYEVLMRALMQDERNPEVLTELLVTLFCDLIQMNDELSRCGVWLQYLLFSCEISVYHPRSGESGLLSIVHEPNKQKQENLIRISTVLLERFESEIPYVSLLSRAPALLHFANEMFSIIISRYTFHEQGEVKQSANRMVPNKNDLVARLANVCKYLRTMVDAESCNEENEDNQLESSIINSPKASITTPQSGEKRPFPDDDSPTTRRDSKKFNDGSKIVSNDFPITAEVDDPELLMATSRSAIEDKKPMAPPPAYEENVFDSSK